ncbi:uncharacterized protein LOC131962715 [Centropristis striata]|uniref:uncharacterized protein LOC131962715 n=1 Tax=Centropristis striata TaxID=184440 RepID=UPI0027DF9E83|nr:uncharacterized protein LOC131962715 [Centropristis striata]
MFKFVLLFLTLSGLQAVPIAKRVQEIPSTYQIPDGFQQGTEPSRRVLDTGVMQGRIREIDSRVVSIRSSLGNGFGEMKRRHLLTDEVPVDVPARRNGGGWVRVELPASPRLPDGFRQGTEPMIAIRDGFRQGTEPMITIPDGFRQGTEPMITIPDGFRQGTEPIMSIPVGFRQGTQPSGSLPDGFRQGTEPMISIRDGFRQGTEPVNSIPDGFRQGTKPMNSIREGFRQEIKHMTSTRDGFSQGIEPFMSIPDGFRQGTEPMIAIRDGFKQGTEPSKSLPDGFRQGTEPMITIPDGFRQGTQPMITIPDGFRQGTEPFMPIADGFRQGTEPMISIRDGFKQGTEPVRSLPDGFRQGTEPFMSIPKGFRQGTERSSSSGLQTKTVACKGEVINGNCYEFNPTPMAFEDAQISCRSRALNAELASVTDRDLHSRLVALVTKGGENNPVLTWLGATVKNQQASWVDGAEWSYSDWMPGHPNIQTDKPACLEMFKIDESWWTAADCELQRASICSYRITA